MREGGSSKVTQRRGNKGSSGDYNDCTNHRLKVISVNHSLPLLSSASVELHKPEPGNNSQLKVTAELKTCSLRCKYHMSTKMTYLIMNVVIKSIKLQVKVKIFCFLPCFTAQQVSTHGNLHYVLMPGFITVQIRSGIHHYLLELPFQLKV